MTGGLEAAIHEGGMSALTNNSLEVREKSHCVPSDIIRQDQILVQVNGNW